MKFRIFFIITLATLLAACGKSQATPDVTTTPDLCAPQNIQPEVQKVNRLMREFDDASVLAANTPKEQLRVAIADLQRIRREAEDQEIPGCLADLKKYQIAHMNTVINTLIGFMGGAQQETVNQGIAVARKQHDQYSLEMLRLLGMTVVPITATPGTDQPAPTTAVQATSTMAGVAVSNAGTSPVNMRATPSLDGAGVGLLQPGESAVVIGRTADNAWYQIQVPNQPGQTAWVYAQLVQVAGPVESVPVVTP
jgi:hypothetical protein